MCLLQMYPWVITLWSLEVGYCSKLTLYRISYHTSQALAVKPQTKQNMCDVVSWLQNACMTYCSMTHGNKLNLHWISYHILLAQAVLLEFWSIDQYSSIICYIWQIKLTRDLLLYDPWRYKAQSTLDILPYFAGPSCAFRVWSTDEHSRSTGPM